MEVTSVAEVREFIRRKQELEMQLADALLAVFNDPQQGLIGPLRHLVGLAMADINGIQKQQPNNFNTVRDKKNWPGYAGVQGFDFRRADWTDGQIAAFASGLKAEHCADWIRIYGEVVEDVLKGSADDKRKSYQTLADEGFWEKKEGGLRQRFDANKNPKHTEYAAARTEAWVQASSRPASGIARWDVDFDKDTTGRMDQVFGLMPGATISGTTTDNIYFLDKFSRMHLDPVYYLLPVAAIVAGGHHSLLEVALPLTLNHVIDYTVGLYTTLLPKQVEGGNAPTGALAIKGVLKNFEEKPENHLMLVYYQGVGQPKGCLLYDTATDLRSWQVIARADERLLRKFKEIKTAWPDRNHVLSLSFMGNERTDQAGKPLPDKKAPPAKK